MQAGEDGADGGDQPQVVDAAGEQSGVVEDDHQHPEEEQDDDQ